MYVLCDCFSQPDRHCMGNYSAYFFYVKCRLKIQMPHLHNAHKYCGNTASGLATYAA